MARNKLCPQDYCNMVIDYIMSKGSLPFTVEKVIKYCIKKTNILDNGDEQQIDTIVRETLKTLTNFAYLEKSGHSYIQIKDVYEFDGFVMDDPKPMGKMTQKTLDRLNDIEARTTYDG